MCIFRWHEIGYNDVPAMIDYVLNETNQTEVTYVGHSQGTTSFFVMASERPEYNKKIKLMVAFAPVVYLSNMKQPVLKQLATNYNDVKVNFNLFYLISQRLYFIMQLK